MRRVLVAYVSTREGLRANQPQRPAPPPHAARGCGRCLEGSVQREPLSRLFRCFPDAEAQKRSWAARRAALRPRRAELFGSGSRRAHRPRSACTPPGLGQRIRLGALEPPRSPTMCACGDGGWARAGGRLRRAGAALCVWGGQWSEVEEARVGGPGRGSAGRSEGCGWWPRLAGAQRDCFGLLQPPPRPRRSQIWPPMWCWTPRAARDTWWKWGDCPGPAPPRRCRGFSLVSRSEGIGV